MFSHQTDPSKVSQPNFGVSTVTPTITGDFKG